MHGTVSQGSKLDSIVHRRLLTREIFYEWMSSQAKFVSIECALEGKGHAITIDDATYAAYETAKLLRAHGHEVTVFVNMFNIENQQTYFFHILNFIVNEISGNDKTLRLHHKENILKISYIEEITEYLKKLCTINQLNYSDILKKINKSVRTMSLSQCIELHDLGVTIGNHFYNHTNPIHFNYQEMRDSITRNSNLIRLYTKQKKKHILAPPFGKLKNQEIYENKFPDYICLFAEKEHSITNYSKNIINRHSLDSDHELQ